MNHLILGAEFDRIFWKKASASFQGLWFFSG